MIMLFIRFWAHVLPCMKRGEPTAHWPVFIRYLLTFFAICHTFIRVSVSPILCRAAPWIQVSILRKCYTEDRIHNSVGFWYTSVLPAMGVLKKYYQTQLLNAMLAKAWMAVLRWLNEEALCTYFYFANVEHLLLFTHAISKALLL